MASGDRFSSKWKSLSSIDVRQSSSYCAKATLSLIYLPPAINTFGIIENGACLLKRSFNVARKPTLVKSLICEKNVKYINHYLKRPPIAASKLCNYTGVAVAYDYYEHYTQRLNLEEMLWRYIDHVLSRHLRWERYYFFLNRKWDELLPKVCIILRIEIAAKPHKLGFYLPM